MIKVKDLQPLNLITEKEKFWRDFSYNPQFEYAHVFSQQELEQWGQPLESYYAFAVEQLEQRGYAPSRNRQIIDPEVIQQVADQVVHQLRFSDQFSIQFEKDKITRCSLVGSTMIFRDPASYDSLDELHGTFNHELQTHFLRNINNKKQHWKLSEMNEHAVRRTEEGLATLHGFLPIAEPYLRKTFLNYFCVYHAQRFSFAKLFALLREKGLEEAAAWEYTMRVKRGIQDTSQTLCNTKDISYLEGTIAVWRWLQDPSHDPHELYIGKIALEELPIDEQKIVTHDVLYPTFFGDMQQYRHKIEHIGKENHLDTFYD